MAKRLTVRTYNGRTTSLVAKLQEQIDEWEMYHQADNFAGWLFRKFIVVDGMSPKRAKRATIKLLRHGSETTIDVRLDEALRRRSSDGRRTW